MKQAIYYITQRVLFNKQERQLIFAPLGNQQFSFTINPFSSEFLSTPSLVMRMCCCSMSC